MFITAIFYNEKGDQFRKVMYCTNTELECIAAIRYEETLLKDFFIKHPNAKDIKARTFELDTWSYDLC